MPEVPRHLRIMRMVQMAGGNEDIRACTGGDRVEVQRWNPGRLNLL
jgi:hypothetical protein